MKKETYEIDDLLAVVGPSLIAGYEAKNLNVSGATLHEANEGYKAVTRAVWFGFGNAAKLAVFSLVVGLILNMSLVIAGVPVYIGFVAMMSIAAPAYVYLICFASPRAKRDRDITEMYATILCEFRQSMKKLDLSSGVWMPYSEVTVHNALVARAAELLKAEMRFKEERMMENAGTESVVAYAGRECMRRSEFEETLRVAEKFGISRSKPELFAEARAGNILDRAC